MLDLRESINLLNFGTATFISKPVKSERKKKYKSGKAQNIFSLK